MASASTPSNMCPRDFSARTPAANTFTDDPFFAGYTGGIQAMYDYTHGYGSNVTGNGYVETDGNRNSLFSTDAPRNDAMIFGEHVAPVPDFQEYLEVGMRLHQPAALQPDEQRAVGQRRVRVNGEGWMDATMLLSRTFAITRPTPATARRKA